jgi:hypothetical protein
MEFDQIIDNISVIENLIGCRISAQHIKKYQDYIDQQMIDFYTLEPGIESAWKIYEQFGADAPIIDIANNSNPYV